MVERASVYASETVSSAVSTEMYRRSVWEFVVAPSRTDRCSPVPVHAVPSDSGQRPSYLSTPDAHE